MRAFILFVAALPLIALVIPSCVTESPAYGPWSGLHIHNEVNGQEDHHSNHPMAMHAGCMRYIEKSEADIPEFFTRLFWIEQARFIHGEKTTAVFYGNWFGRTVAASWSANDPTTGKWRERLSWEVGDAIRTIHPDENEMVCERPILVLKGVRYDLRYTLLTYVRKNKPKES